MKRAAELLEERWSIEKTTTHAETSESGCAVCVTGALAAAELDYRAGCAGGRFRQFGLVCRILRRFDRVRSFRISFSEQLGQRHVAALITALRCEGRSTSGSHRYRHRRLWDQQLGDHCRRRRLRFRMVDPMSETYPCWTPTPGDCASGAGSHDARRYASVFEPLPIPARPRAVISQITVRAVRRS